MENLITDSLLILAAGGVLGSIGKALMVVLGLGLVIFFHELGHFAVAKWCDVHVERFSIGIGWILWSRQIGETEYALSVLPLGGYVKMLGQDDMDPNQMTSEEIAENPRSYSAKKVWQRMLIISAGVIMNIITGFGFFAIAYNIGVREVLPQVGLVVPGSPAWEAGVQQGDTIDRINGGDIQSFGDVQEAIILSSGELEIEGTGVDGDAFHRTVVPHRQKQTRQIGVGPSLSLKIDPRAGRVSPIAMPGLPASKASSPFEPGDRIVAVNGEEMIRWKDLSLMTARHAADELVYTVERNAAPDADNSTTEERVDITVPAAPMRSIGLWMAIGPVQSIQVNSIAAQAGMEKGDIIRKVDGREVGIDIDPLRLPNYFADRAGSEVKVTVLRKKEGSIGEVEIELTMTPADIPGWSEMPSSESAPLPIPAVGAAYRVTTRIAKVVAGSEAASITDEETRFAADQRITKVVLPYSVDDALGNESKGAHIIKLDDPDEEPVNWAYVFMVLQRAPERDILIHVDRGENAPEGSVRLETREFADDWYLPIRGIGGFQTASRERIAESTAEAVQLGARRTRSAILSVYATLKSLFRQDLSPKALSGPLGIVSIGYQIADNGLAELLRFLGILSMNLAVLNFLPIPILDGGHMVFLIWEGVTRRKPSMQVINWAHGVGLLFIISLFLFVIYLDVVVRFMGLGGD